MMGSVKMFGIVLLVCIINTKLIDAYDDYFVNDYVRRVLSGVNDAKEREPTAKNHPASDFLVHTRVTPKIYHGREKRQISTTLEKNGKHTSHIEIVMDIDRKNLTLDLTLNRQLIPQGFFHKHQMNGGHKIFYPNLQEANLCEYNGNVRGVPNSWVAISTCEGISGVIFDGNDLHYVEKGTNMESSTESAHFLYSHSNLAMNNRSCVYVKSDDHLHAIDNIILRHKRFVNQSTVLRVPYNANEESRYLELLMVMDNDEYTENGKSKSRTLNHAKNIANIVNALYARLNIFVALVGVVIWTEYDEITLTSNAERMLLNFLKYRREKLVHKHPNDNAQLITKQKYFGYITVTETLKGHICTFEYSGGVTTDFSPVVGLIASSVAHSIGHNFGMEHDTEKCKCPKTPCIMASIIESEPITDWSSCSVNYLHQAFSQGMDYCLRNIPKWLFDGPICGNGFLEEGEQCDCGLPEYCNNSCCNAETCTMRINANCAHGLCCNIETCTLKTAGTLCRSSISECDLEEYCNGYSEICPADYHKLEAEVCDSGKAYCYQGSCKSRTDQCKLLWGETGEPSDSACYELNTKGSRDGNCGYNKLNQSFIKCEDGNQFCGLLHCKHPSEKLEFVESFAILTHTFINKERQIIPCRSALVDLGLDQIDPGLTPNGSPCGLGKMCLNQKCISVSGLRNQGPSCPRDCNGNGWCNNKGNCHCKAGFALPYCDFPGPGGSLDSGPASDPKALWRSHLQYPSSSTINQSTMHVTDTASNMNNTSMNSYNAAAASDIFTLLPEDPGSILNDTSTNLNTSSNLNNTPTSDVSTLHPDDTHLYSENTATDLNNESAASEAPSPSENEIAPNLNDTETTSDASITTKINFFPFTYAQIVIYIVFSNL